jgi:glutathione S-transferase
LVANAISIADVAIFPFVRQFAGVDRDWFDSTGFDRLIAWLRAFVESKRFRAIMQKRPLWRQESVDGNA